MLMGCATSTEVKTQYIYPKYDESLMFGCSDWKPITQTQGKDLIIELKQNRVNNQRCFLKWQGLVESIKSQQKS